MSVMARVHRADTTTAGCDGAWRMLEFAHKIGLNPLNQFQHLWLRYYFSALPLYCGQPRIFAWYRSKFNAFGDR